MCASDLRRRLPLAVDGTEIGHAGVIYVSQHGKDVGELVRRIDGTLDDAQELDGEILYA